MAVNYLDRALIRGSEAKRVRSQFVLNLLLPGSPTGKSKRSFGRIEREEVDLTGKELLAEGSVT